MAINSGAFIFRNRKRASGKTWIFLAVLVCLIFLIFLSAIFPKNITGPLYYVVAPIWGIERVIADKIYGYADILNQKQSLLDENARQKSELEELRNRIMSLSDLEKENKEIRSLFIDTGIEKTILVEVLIAPPIAPYDIIILKAGAESGLKTGDYVTVFGGIVIGEITDVYDKYSRARLYSSPGSEIEVILGQEQDNIRALARGAGGGAYEILLPREIEVKKGDEVRMTGHSRYVFGVVSNVKTRETDYLALITFESPVNIYGLRYVAILPGTNVIISPDETKVAE